MIIFLIPTYNEENNIGLLLENTRKKMEEMGYDYKVIVINDGSTDKTKEIVESFKDHMPVEIISHFPNKGVKETFLVGFESALKIAENEDIIVTKEADNTSDLNILDAMIKNVESGSDVVLASCYAKKGRIENSTWIRLLNSWCANLLLKTFFYIPGVNTFSSFYRAFNAGTFKRAFLAYERKLFTQDGYVCVVEMLIKLSKLNLKITEVPMILYSDRRKGASKMKVSQTILGYFKLILCEQLRDRKIEDEASKKFAIFLKKRTI